MMKKVTVAIMVVILGMLLCACSAKPELVIDNASRQRGDGNGNDSSNVYTFIVKNKTGGKIDAIDHFHIYFYDGNKNQIGVWKANSTALAALASLDEEDTCTLNIKVSESDLPYSEDWSYDMEYSLN